MCLRSLVGWGGCVCVRESGTSVPLLTIAATAVVASTPPLLHTHLGGWPTTSDVGLSAPGGGGGHPVVHIGGAVRFRELCLWRRQASVPQATALPDSFVLGLRALWTLDSKCRAIAGRGERGPFCRLGGGGGELQNGSWERETDTGHAKT